MSYNLSMPRHPNPKTETGRVILELREKKGWTQAELALRSGLSKPTIQRIESGHHNAERDSLEAIAKALGVPVRQLLPAWTEESKRLVQEFMASGMGQDANPTAEELAWMQSAELAHFFGVKPTPQVVFKVLDAYRTAQRDAQREAEKKK